MASFGSRKELLVRISRKGRSLWQTHTRDRAKDSRTVRCPTLLPSLRTCMFHACACGCGCVRGCQSCKSKTCATASKSRPQKRAHLHSDHLCLLGSERALSGALAEWAWVSDREKHWLYKIFGANGGILVGNAS